MFSVSHHLFIPSQTNNHRPRILHVPGLFVLVGVLVASQALISIATIAPAPLPSILGFSSSITASQVVDQTNSKRSEAGLSALTVNTSLVSAAIAKGNDMCQEQYWAHISPKGTTPWVFMKNAGYRYSVAGENLARDFSETGSMVSAWMASPTHRANIVNGKYTEIGVGVVDCKLLGSDTTLVVQMFGARTAQTAKKPTIPQAAAVTEPPTTPAPTPQIKGEESAPDFITSSEQLTLTTPSPTTVPLRIFSPLQLTKAISISVLTLLGIVLSLDLWITHKRHTIRLVGRNIGHLIFLSAICLIVILIKAGIVG